MRTILECRSAFVTDLEYPLPVLNPEVLHETPFNFSFVRSMVEQDALRVFSALLGKSFNSYSHLERQLKRIKTELDLDKRVGNKSLWCKILAPAAITSSDTIRFLNAQINAAATYEMRAAYKWDSLTTGQKACFHFTARYTQINKLLYKAWQTGSHPVFSSNQNWNFWL